MLLLVLAAAPVAHAASDGGDAQLGAAVRLFRSAQYRKAEEGFAAVVRRRPDDAVARFWLAYAQYEQGRMEEAELSVRRALARDPRSVDASYLAGLLAFAGKRWGEAEQRFDLVRREAPQSALGRSAASYLEQLRWQQRLATALQSFEARRYREAADRLRRLAQERPRNLIAAYYYGYALYELHDYEGARAQLEAALRIDPTDRWTRYMLALTLAELGHEAEAEKELRALTGARDGTVATEARKALASAAAARETAVGSERQPAVTTSASERSREPEGSTARWWVSTAAGVDSNPAYIPESSYSGQAESAAALSAAATGDVVLIRRTGTRLTASPRTLLRFYPGGPRELELAQLEGRLELSHETGSIQGWLGAAASASSLGWKLFLDVEEAWAGGSWRQAAWTASRVTLDAYRRGSHLVEYHNLEALGLEARVAQRVLLGTHAYVELGYAAQRESAAAYAVDWSGERASDATPYQASLSADASFIGHGPSVGFSLALPWRELRLTTSLDYQRRLYDDPETVTYDVAGQSSTTTRERSDGRVLVSAALSLAIASPLFAFLRYDGVVNQSSVAGQDFPTDRNYTRHLGLVGVEARF